ncbi:hypothetical protein SEPCBS119000_003359 [Sporothrix epigloea]|uniref:Zn(2)-C6 fungal-type domain-containing protein n=1 Tax=Sporothrix epigloea TaxID=1892477 RepID=A0ABP0DPV5_9PEZI
MRAISRLSNGQLSPISDGIDIPGATGNADLYSLTAPSSLLTAPTLSNSTPQSSPKLEASTSPPSNVGPSELYTSGTTCGHGQDHYGDAVHNHADTGDEMQWDFEDGQNTAVPKSEPTEDDNLCLSDLEEAPVNYDPAEIASVSSATKFKRPRGRPRKLSNVQAAAAIASKIAKGRSKTGCITCRKRKKKCDESKPRCMNCEKNAVVCEGYQEKQLWKSGKEKAEEELLKSNNLPVFTMRPIFTGLEIAEDRVFWRHYNGQVSAVFTVEGEYNNAFRDMLVPIATSHRGMMHSILSLASKHLDYDAPSGQKVLRRNARLTLDSLHHRGSFHNSEAVRILRKSMSGDSTDDPDYNNLLEAQYGQMLCLVLEALAERDNSSTQRVHYGAFLYLIKNQPPQDDAFRDFISEIFYYHILADDMIHYPDSTASRLVTEQWTLASPIAQPRLIGVADGMFRHLCQITTIRSRVRKRIRAGSDSCVDYVSLYRATEIESHIHDWAPEWPAGDSRWRVTLLYKQMAWLYLKTTICPPLLPSSSQSATRLSSSHGISAMPPPSAPHHSSPDSDESASCTSSPSPQPKAMVSHDNHLNPRRHSIANPISVGDTRPFLQATAEDHSDRAQTLMPLSARVRRTPNHEASVDLVVQESLALLESFPPSDPSQTLLLLPCVVIGAACYSKDSRDRISNAICVVHGYTGLHNTTKALKVLATVWQLHDAGDHLGAWDWQAVAHSLGVHYLF